MTEYANQSQSPTTYTKTYHIKIKDNTYILYIGVDGSLDGHNALVDCVSSQWIDMTGGQAAFYDGDLKEFGDELVEASKETGYKIYEIYRMYDPGLGLDFAEWWVKGGIAAGVFEKYELPEDVQAK